MWQQIRKALGAVGRFLRHITGVRNLPAAATVFTVVCRVGIVGLGVAALLATLVPGLAADPVAIRLLGASSALWEAGNRGYTARSPYSFPEWEGRPAIQRPTSPVSAVDDDYQLGDGDDPDDDPDGGRLPGYGWSVGPDGGIARR